MNGRPLTAYRIYIHVTVPAHYEKLEQNWTISTETSAEPTYMYLSLISSGTSLDGKYKTTSGFVLLSINARPCKKKNKNKTIP
jgi:hypothetical protein